MVWRKVKTQIWCGESAKPRHGVEKEQDKEVHVYGAFVVETENRFSLLLKDKTANEKRPEENINIGRLPEIVELKLGWGWGKRVT
ncbi:hypothetical protein ElyMa_006169700 [Elysia marginata]|uniref:Uncharacterized protein n=1 Tax=Elysia marginata TaxID=1093978 RepID=A0AAV4H192_9GAST|nr:hypothetical protein ElyMa_006169700 [Elysia marginata]